MAKPKAISPTAPRTTSKQPSAKQPRATGPVSRAALPVRELAGQAFSRAAGAPLLQGNRVRLLKDAKENYPAWLEAIRSARRYIHFENYIISEDKAGNLFADALAAKAREGVCVRLVHDWMGGLGKTSRGFWRRLRESGVEIRCYNPPRFDSPLGWVSRDHRKSLTVDGRIGFVTGLCVGEEWLGVPEKRIDPWRDTGVEIIGPAVADIEQPFSEVWASMGEPLPAHEIAKREEIPADGEIALRIVSDEPASAGLMRLDQLVAALASERLWLTDAYYAGTASYVQALRAAAQDGVDVRLLVPNSTDIPVLKPLSRSGYRTLLEAGIRIFEWNGTMLHAKTAVADGRWARVGSSNLNLASWLGNCELDVVVEDEAFAEQMAQMYLQDLENATEVVLNAKHRAHAPGEPPHPSPGLSSGGGSGGRVAAGAFRIGNAVGAAFTDRRTLEPVEARTIMVTGLGLVILVGFFGYFPRLLAYPLLLISLWVGLALVYRGYCLYRQRDSQ